METVTIFGIELSMGTLTILAILVSPAIAVGVSMWIQNRLKNQKEKLGHKKHIFSILMSTRHLIVTDEIVRALNMIDVAFHDNEEIRRIWNEYYEMLLNEGLNNPTGWEQWKTKKLELITAMAKEVGYKEKITHIDVNRAYSPRALAEDSFRAIAIGEELLRVLKESHGIKFVPKEETESERKPEKNTAQDKK